MTEDIALRLSVPLDRAAHRRDDPEWLAQAWRCGKVLVVAADGRALIRGGVPAHAEAAGAARRLSELVLLPPDQVARPGSAGRMFLGVDEQGNPYFAVTAELPSVADARPRHLWEVGAELSVRDARLFAQALGLAQWHADYRHSPMTGSPTEVVQAGWVRRDADGELHFPRTDPAAIMLVHDGVPGQSGRALLGSGALWTPAQGVRRYSTLAGFIEPGESAEAAVIREVLEEVGVHVTRLSYVGSQPWPYPRSLMLGFTALADPAEPIVIDPAELADARWFTREEIGAVREGSADGFRLPNRSSIAHRLVEHWLHDGGAEIR